MRRCLAMAIWLPLCAGSARAAAPPLVAAPDAATLDYLAEWLAGADDPAPDDPVLQLLAPTGPNDLDSANPKPLRHTPEAPRRP